MLDSPKRHVVISGTGRAGTTYLVQLLTAAGLDTGFNDIREGVFENCKAGMERDLYDSELPYIVKSPRVCEYLDQVILQKKIVIDHIIVPMRDLFSAAESRRRVSASYKDTRENVAVPGGLWGVQSPELQECALAERFYKLIYTAVREEIPITFMLFPRIVSDVEYLYNKLLGVFPQLDRDQVQEAFSKVARPEFVHAFE